MMHYLLHFGNKLSQVGKFMINAGKTHVSDFVKPAQPFHNLLSDKPGGDLLTLLTIYIFLDGFSQLFHLLHGDRPFVTGLLDAGNDPLAVIRDAATILFYYC